jgi:hypothetical protein
MPNNLHLVPAATTPDPVSSFECAARLRARVLRRACFSSQLTCAEFYRVGLTSIRCYESGERKIPGWYLMALEQRARELRVTVAAPVAEAA